MRARIAFAAVVVATVAAAGCGSPPSRVRGVVTYQGAPLPGAFLTFRASDGQAYSATSGPDGRYEVTGLSRGAVAVSVQGHLPGRATPAGAAETYGRKVSDAEKARGGGGPEPGPPLPDKYMDPARSGLGFELVGSEFEYNVDLK